jgi:hypothetical protein
MSTIGLNTEPVELFLIPATSLLSTKIVYFSFIISSSDSSDS